MLAKQATITHKCNHTKVVFVKGVKELRQYQKWLGAQVCTACESAKK